LDPSVQGAAAAAIPAGSPEGLRRLAELTGVALDALGAEAARREGPLPAGGPAAMRAAADELPDTFLPERGLEPAEAVRWLSALSARWGVDLTSPAAVGRMQCAPTAVSVAAELGGATLNQGLQAWESGPFAALLERRLLADLGALAGYPPGAAGSITSGGSASNLMGLLLARDDAVRRRAGVDVSETGLASLGLTPRVLCSAGTHVSARRAVRFTGLGSDAIVEVESDRLGRMLPGAAQAALASMRGDELPVALVATAGTTDFGAFDPLRELADVSTEHGVWLHVDAAYGAGALFSERLGQLVEGAGRADSLALDLHKFGWTPASSGVFLTRRPEALSALAQGAAYLGAPEDEALGFGSLAHASLQTTRRADALKIAATLLALGRTGMRELVDRCRDLAVHAAGAIEANPRLELAAEPVLTTVVFRCRPASAGAPGEDWDRLNAAVRRALIEEGRVLVARAVVPDARGREAEHLKLVLLNPATSALDLDVVIDEIAAAADAIDPTGGQG
jgi:L-2,4-diaminobutyrate decarboxylase